MLCRFLVEDIATLLSVPGIYYTIKKSPRYENIRILLRDIEIVLHNIARTAFGNPPFSRFLHGGKGGGCRLRCGGEMTLSGCKMTETSVTFPGRSAALSKNGTDATRLKAENPSLHSRMTDSSTGFHFASGRITFGGLAGSNLPTAADLSNSMLVRQPGPKRPTRSV